MPEILDGAKRYTDTAHGCVGSRGDGCLSHSAGSVLAAPSMPSFLIRLRRWLSRCAQAVAHFASSRKTVPLEADPWRPSPRQRRCLSEERQPRSWRRAGARARPDRRPQGQTSSARRGKRRRATSNQKAAAGGKRNCTHAKSAVVVSRRAQKRCNGGVNVQGGASQLPISTQQYLHPPLARQVCIG